MSKIDQLSQRLAALHVEMERRFGQVTTALFLIGAAVIIAIGPHSLGAHIILGILQ